MNHFAQAVDALDAAVFNGGELMTAGNRELLRSHIERWQRQLTEWELTANEGAYYSGIVTGKQIGRAHV